jgi:hypothetical protein
MTRLCDVSISEWNKLADDYAKTKAILIMNILYRGIDSASGKEVCYIDDYDSMVDNEIMLIFFRVTGTRNVSGHKIKYLVGDYFVQTKKGYKKFEENGEVWMEWDPIYFAWSRVHKRSTEDVFNNKFMYLGIDINKPREVIYQVPFGHVIGMEADPIDLMSNNLHPFYSTSFHKLGKLGQLYSEKNRIII